MANRFTTLISKNSDIVNRPLPSSLLGGEAIVNTADGIVWYSGVTTSTNEWTPAGTGTTANFFEVGSNLYDLQLRNRITRYEGVTGGALNGKFLSGTTAGFVLADISNISGVDSFLTGGTYNGTDLTLTLNNGAPDVVIGGISDTFITGFTYNNANTIEIRQNGGIPPFTVDIGIMTGLTVNGAISATSIDASTIYSGGTDLATLISGNDTYATGYTFNSATNTFEIVGNNTFAPLSSTIDSLSGLSLNNLTAGRVVYVGTGGLLTDEVGFTYNDSTNVLSTPVNGGVVVGTSGLVVGSGGSVDTAGDGDVVIHGNLTIFGNAISAFTSELYVEDPNIVINYNPTGSTVATSEGAGLTIQDGSGIVTEDVSLDIHRLDTLTGLTATNIPNITEYTSGIGYENRGWVTQLNDIVIRSTNVTTPNGVRVLAEFDILDGGTY